MRDKKKLLIPKSTKYPLIGDVNISVLGKSIFVPLKVFKNIKKFFKINFIFGESNNIPGDIKVFIEELNRDCSFTPTKYLQVKNKFRFKEVVGNNIENSSNGDIIVYNPILKLNAIFKYSDWVNSNDSWEIKGIVGILTYSESEAKDGDYVIMANGTTLIIDPIDYSKLNNNWEHIDTIILNSNNA